MTHRVWLAAASSAAASSAPTGNAAVQGGSHGGLIFANSACTSMAVWIDRLLMIALVVVVGVLSGSALPFFAGRSISGDSLLVHMMASGALVIGLPLFGLFYLRHLWAARPISWTHQLGYLAVLATGLVTIATVFLCMLPIPSTEQMHSLMTAHGWAGFAMVPAVLLMLVGLLTTAAASRRRS